MSQIEKELSDIILGYIVTIYKEIMNSVNKKYLDFGVKIFFDNFANIFREYNLIPNNYISEITLLYN